MLFEINTINQPIIYGTELPYTGVLNIVDCVVDITKLNTTEQVLKEFRWSKDSHTYSEWFELTTANLIEYIRLTYNSFWIDYKITLLTAGKITINSIDLNVVYKQGYNSVPIPIGFKRDSDLPFYPLEKKTFTYNPYKQNPTIKLFKDMSMNVNLIHGHEVSYLRAVPNPKTRDVIFLEWTLYDYEDPQNIKLIVPNNEFPPNVIQYNPWGLDFEVPFEVHVDKRYWESIFGFNTAPQKRDALYFPIINRMFKVETAYLISDFMQEGIYYKILLVKWTDNSNIGKSENIKELIEDVTTSVEELFGEEIKAEMQSITNEMQTKDKTTKEDPIREYISSVDINTYITEERLENNETLIANYYYNMLLLHQENPYSTAIRYKASVELPADKSRSFTCWFNMPENKTIKKGIKSISITDTIGEIEFNYGMPNIIENGWIKIIDKTNSNIQLIGKVTSVFRDIATFRATVEFPLYLLQSLDAMFPTWKTGNLEAYDVARRNFITGNDGSKGINIDIFDNNLLRILLNDVDYWYRIEGLLHNFWYGMVINLSSPYNQIGVHIWKRQSNSAKSTKMVKMFSEISNGIPAIDRSADINYSLISSNLKITNIRLLNDILGEEKHSIFLNQNIITDAQNAIIIDNSLPKMKLPYIGQVK